MPSITFRLSPTLHERFVQECEKRDISPSEFMRKAVEAMMDRMDEPALRETTGAYTPILTPPTPSLLFAGRVSETNKATHADFVHRQAVRGFAMDGSPLVTKRDRLKGPKK